MIDLTPLEVRKKKGDFRRALRGYEPELVDDFLDMVADRLEELVRDNLALNERVARLEERVTDYREREKALTEALVSAQEFREEQLNHASREAELRLREAESEAQRIREGALRDRDKEEAALRRVRARRVQLVESFRAFLEREMHQIEVESAALELNDISVEAGERLSELDERPLPATPPPPPERVALSDLAMPAPRATAPAPEKEPVAAPELSIAPKARPAPAPAPSPGAPAAPPNAAPAPAASSRGPRAPLPSRPAGAKPFAPPPPAAAPLAPPPAPEPTPPPPSRPRLVDDGPPITGNEEWLPLLDDER